MAVRHRLIEAGPEDVWDVLADGARYADWVVGTARSRPLRGQWPQLGSAIAYEVRFGPVTLTNETVVRRCVEGRELELEAQAGRLGTARIAFTVRSWGPHCLVTVDEHPLRGTAGLLHNGAIEVLIQVRHRAMLGRLAEVCEGGACARPAGGRHNRRGGSAAAGAR